MARLRIAMIAMGITPHGCKTSEDKQRMSTLFSPTRKETVRFQERTAPPDLDLDR
jgi:hypothetical protein